MDGWVGGKVSGMEDEIVGGQEGGSTATPRGMRKGGSKMKQGVVRG